MNPPFESSPAIKRITVVIPVYGDWKSLKSCALSVLAHAPASEFDVLFVNDCGPEADVIEERLLSLIGEREAVRYERNEQNLGFGQTCNRAVFELDETDNDILLLNSDAEITAGSLQEMREVLALSERHAVVCPRSNDATIASMPVHMGDPDEIPRRQVERSKVVFESLATNLPRYYIAPVAVGFCMLVRRSVIENYGFFDEAFGKGYNEENDFCSRINLRGYSSIIANHAFVSHLGSQSFGKEKRRELDRANARTLLKRFPYFDRAVATFVRTAYVPEDRFADLLVAEERKAKILIDLHHMSLVFDGSTRNAISFLTYVQSLSEAMPFDVTVAAQEDAIEFFHLRDFGFKVVLYGSLVEVFDVGVAIAPITSFSQLVTLNRHCMRWIVTFLDVIALRSWDLRMMDTMRVEAVRGGLQWADRIVAISRATLQDASAYFPDLASELESKTIVIHQGSATATMASTDDVEGVPAMRLPESDGYIFVVGNAFPHKQVQESLSVLSGGPADVVALGSTDVAKKFPELNVLPAGKLSSSQIKELYRRSAVVVFPSAYEGFGLPLLEAAEFGKPIVLFDTQVGRELTAELGLANRVEFFSVFRELEDAVTRARALGPGANDQKVRSISEYNAELWKQIVLEAQTKIDLARLTSRDEALRLLPMLWDEFSNKLSGTAEEIRHIKESNVFRLARLIARAAKPVRLVFPKRKSLVRS